MLPAYGFQDQEKNIQCMTSKIENIYEVGSHEFSRNQKCYRWFSMISGHGNEKLFFMEIEILGFRTPKTSHVVVQVK